MHDSLINVFPNEIFIEGIFPYIKLKGILILVQTCKFFRDLYYSMVHGSKSNIINIMINKYGILTDSPFAEYSLVEISHISDLDFKAILIRKVKLDSGDPVIIYKTYDLLCKANHSIIVEIAEKGILRKSWIGIILCVNGKYDLIEKLYPELEEFVPENLMQDIIEYFSLSLDSIIDLYFICEYYDLIDKLIEENKRGYGFVSQIFDTSCWFKNKKYINCSHDLYINTQLVVHEDTIKLPQDFFPNACICDLEFYTEIFGDKYVQKHLNKIDLHRGFHKSENIYIECISKFIDYHLSRDDSLNINEFLLSITSIYNLYEMRKIGSLELVIKSEKFLSVNYICKRFPEKAQYIEGCIDDV